MRRVCRLLPLTVVAGLFGCAAPQPAADPPQAAAAKPANAAPIDAATLQALYAAPHREDGTVMRGSHKGAEWTKWSKPDGSMELQAGHGLFADSGKYSIRGNTICTAWGHIDSGKEECVRLVRVSADEYVSYGPDGSEGSRFKVEPP